MVFNTIRLDHKIIYQIIEPGSRVLDLGCGAGDLIYFLAKEKNVLVQGIELSEEAIHQCVEKIESNLESEDEHFQILTNALIFDTQVIEGKQSHQCNGDTQCRGIKCSTNACTHTRGIRHTRL